MRLKQNLDIEFPKSEISEKTESEPIHERKRQRLCKGCYGRVEYIFKFSATN